MRQKSKQFLLAMGLAISAVMFFACSAVPAVAADEPFMVTSPLNSTVPFNVTLPTTTSTGKAVKTVEINFVTADCVAGAGTTVIGSAQVTVLFNSQNGFYHLAFGPPQVFVLNTEFVITQPTLMFADPGSTINFGISGGTPTCTVVFAGHLIPK